MKYNVVNKSFRNLAFPKYELISIFKKSCISKVKNCMRIIFLNEVFIHFNIIVVKFYRFDLIVARFCIVIMNETSRVLSNAKIMSKQVTHLICTAFDSMFRYLMPWGKLRNSLSTRNLLPINLTSKYFKVTLTTTGFPNL